MTCKRDVEKERLSLASELIKIPGLAPLYRHSIKHNQHGFIQDLSLHGYLIGKLHTWRRTGGDFLVTTSDDEVVALGRLAPRSVD
jgi:hypothetical protein